MNTKSNSIYDAIYDMIYDAYILVDGERKYQVEKWPDHKHPVASYLTYMWHHYRAAEAIDSTVDASSREHYENARAHMRKIAALAFACMEENGVVYRATPGTRWQRIKDYLLMRLPQPRFVKGPVMRVHVRSAVMLECDHQNKQSTELLEFSEHLALLRVYLTKADNAWATIWSESAGLDDIRKIAAIAVRAIEQHATPARMMR